MKSSILFLLFVCIVAFLLVIFITFPALKMSRIPKKAVQIEILKPIRKTLINRILLQKIESLKLSVSGREFDGKLIRPLLEIKNSETEGNLSCKQCNIPIVGVTTN